jgi:hypothetical protein
LIEKGDCLSNLLVKLGEVVEIALDLIDGQVNEHTSDLGSSLLSNQLLNELIDEFSDETLVVGVLRDHSGEESESSDIVVGNHGIRVGKGSLRDTSASWSSDDNLLNRLLSEDRLLNLGERNWLSLLVVIVGASVLVVVVSTLVSGSSGATTIVVAVGTVVVIEITLRSVVVVEGEATVHLLLEKNEDLLNELDGVGLLKEVGVDLVGGELFPLVVEVGLVLGLGLLLPADLGQLVVGHVQLLPVHGRSVELGSSDGGAVGLLEADEGAARGLVVVRGQDLHALDLAELLEMLHQVLLVELGGEVLHEEVALLL